MEEDITYVLFYDRLSWRLSLKRSEIPFSSWNEIAKLVKSQQLFHFSRDNRIVEEFRNIGKRVDENSASFEIIRFCKWFPILGKYTLTPSSKS